MEISMGRGGEKTNPIQSQSHLAPSTAVGLKSRLKKQSQFCGKAKAIRQKEK